ncbi:N-acetylmuramoyl-L-alanine amidase [Tumidithrix elongata RA019]|uniref:N-acetylmuramoyl-L-alanine amidase n=1 Tax=Tumidithrix elongata BACA0141 TaxID=2716417 RepID=A0AAW9PVF1_9CYAN|nr:N-acetylmuramoyl-L-alanine amidase [Tumidithrix elongata RA019]
MGKIFVSAGHGGFEGTFRDPGAIAGGTTEAAELIATRDLIVAELRSRALPVEAPGDDLSLEDTVNWINARATRQDVALEIHMDAFNNPDARGAATYYIANNDIRKRQAELLLNALVRRVPELPSRGAKPDTNAGVGRLAFCRDIVPASILMELGFLTNPQDRRLIQTRRRDYAIGIADGLQMWLSDITGVSPTPSPTPVPTVYPEIGINLNGQSYGEKGIIVNGNAYIPFDLVDRLGISLDGAPNIRKIRYQNIVFVQAIGLRDLNVSVTWDNSTRTVNLKTIFKVCPENIDRIMGVGNTSELQLLMFLKNNNEMALTVYGDLPKLYREEAALEGVNHDIAFSQMCVETGFLRFGNDVAPNQNNFAGIGAIGNSVNGAKFPDQRTGVRAHIQHLKAYASTAPLIQPLVDPRFQFVTRGIAPLVSQLTGRWATDALYDRKILATIRRLYESAGIL